MQFTEAPEKVNDSLKITHHNSKLMAEHELPSTRHSFHLAFFSLKLYLVLGTELNAENAKIDETRSIASMDIHH